MTYMFYQKVGGPTTWECALAEDRHRLAVEERVEFVTALDVDNAFTEELPLEARLGVKYTGPFYMDFDGDLDEVLCQVKLLAAKLEDEKAFDLEQARWYFTGGRGIHVEIPHEVFVSRAPRGGVIALPLLYREIAMSLYVDTLDLRVYSTGKGRMWRTPNVKRSNGLYKVQVSLQEVLEATPESYTQICSAPRPPLSVNPPTFNTRLALLYSQAKDKVEAGIKKRKARKSSGDAAKNFHGEWPDSVKLLLFGDCLREGLGWNQIALQLASFALAIGKSEDQLVEDSRPLIEGHSGDSDRYGTPRKREKELRNQYRYQDGSVTYEFSIGGIKSLFQKGFHNSDLDRGEYVPDEPTQPGEDGTDASSVVSNDPLGVQDLSPEPIDEEAIREAQEESRRRLKVAASKAGLFIKGEEGFVKVSAAGFTNPVLLRSLDTGALIGYEVEVFVDLQPRGRHLLPMSALVSKANLQSWLTNHQASILATDAFIPNFADFLRLNTKKGSNMITVSREGVDVIQPPVTPEHPTPRPREIIFASNTAVLSTQGTPLRFRGRMDEHGTFKTDLWHADELVDTPETRKYFEHLMQINSPLVVAQLLGWYSACFLCQLLRVAFAQFPSMQAWGQAGSGKSKSTELMLYMHYWSNQPKKLSSIGSTAYPIMAAVTQSASIPVIFDEFKPREMPKHNKDLLSNIFRTNYNGDSMERGSLTRDSGVKEIVINTFSNVAPVGFIGEALVDQSAIRERCISIVFSKQSRSGRGEHFDYVFSRRREGPLPSLGKALAQAALSTTIQQVADTVSKYRSEIRSKISRNLSEDAERPLYNQAVLLTALDFVKDVLGLKFGNHFDAPIEGLKRAIDENIDNALLVTMSEGSKVLDTLAQLTRVQDETFRLEKNVDYQLAPDFSYVEINIRSAYAKYVRFCRSINQEALYDNDRAMVAGLALHPSVLAQGPEVGAGAGGIRRTPFEKIYRFSCAKMAEEMIDQFYES